MPDSSILGRVLARREQILDAFERVLRPKDEAVPGAELRLTALAQDPRDPDTLRAIALLCDIEDAALVVTVCGPAGSLTRLEEHLSLRLNDRGRTMVADRWRAKQGENEGSA